MLPPASVANFRAPAWLLELVHKTAKRRDANSHRKNRRACTTHRKSLAPAMLRHAVEAFAARNHIAAIGVGVFCVANLRRDDSQFCVQALSPASFRCVHARTPRARDLNEGTPT